MATAAPDAPGFWSDAETDNGLSGGFERELADELARRLGLQEVVVERIDFADIAAGRLGRADLALSQMTPTSGRERHADFTTPYLSAAPAVLARASVANEGDTVDMARLRALRFAVVEVSTLAAVVRERIRPVQESVSAVDRNEELALLRRGAADAVVLDLPVAQALARRHPDDFVVLGRLGGDEGLAAVLPNGSPNLAVVDSAIRAMQSDGTIDGLRVRWLGTDADIPFVRSDD